MVNIIGCFIGWIMMTNKTSIKRTDPHAGLLDLETRTFEDKLEKSQAETLRNSMRKTMNNDVIQTTAKLDSHFALNPPRLACTTRSKYAFTNVSN